MREKSVSLLTSMFKHKNNPRDNTFFRKMSQERNVSNVLPDVREVPLEDLDSRLQLSELTMYCV